MKEIFDETNLANKLDDDLNLLGLQAPFIRFCSVADPEDVVTLTKEYTGGNLIQVVTSLLKDMGQEIEKLRKEIQQGLPEGRSVDVDFESIPHLHYAGTTHSKVYCFVVQDQEGASFIELSCAPVFTA